MFVVKAQVTGYLFVDGSLVGLTRRIAHRKEPQLFIHRTAPVTRKFSTCRMVATIAEMRRASGGWELLVR